jgi:hypothetical protein
VPAQPAPPVALRRHRLALAPAGPRSSRTHRHQRDGQHAVRRDAYLPQGTQARVRPAR